MKNINLKGSVNVNRRYQGLTLAIVGACFGVLLAQQLNFYFQARMLIQRGWSDCDCFFQVHY